MRCDTDLNYSKIALELSLITRQLKSLGIYFIKILFQKLIEGYD